MRETWFKEDLQEEKWRKEISESKNFKEKTSRKSNTKNHSLREELCERTRFGQPLRGQPTAWAERCELIEWVIIDITSDKSED